MRQYENAHAWVDSRSMSSIKMIIVFKSNFIQSDQLIYRKLRQWSIITKLNQIRRGVLQHQYDYICQRHSYLQSIILRYN